MRKKVGIEVEVRWMRMTMMMAMGVEMVDESAGGAKW